MVLMLYAYISTPFQAFLVLTKLVSYKLFVIISPVSNDLALNLHSLYLLHTKMQVIASYLQSNFTWWSTFKIYFHFV